MYDKSNLLESVSLITRGRDTKSLGKDFLKVLADFIEFDALVLFHKPRNSNDGYMDMVSCIPSTAFQEMQKSALYKVCEQGVKHDEHITRCIVEAETVVVALDGLQRILIPVVVNNAVIDIIDIHGHHFSASTENIIHGFTRIYSNFLTILDDNEHDTLTGLLNRKTFDLRLSELIAISDKNNDDIACFVKERRAVNNETYHWAGILDIDYFKKINDNFGHVFGDEILLLFANLMGKTFRAKDLLFRYGGEEFVVVLTPVTASDAFMAFERFRKILESYDFPQVDQVTVSIGMVKIADQEHSTTVLEHADQALYYAKDHGRNQVCDYHELIKSGDIEVLNVESEVDFF